MANSDANDKKIKEMQSIIDGLKSDLKKDEAELSRLKETLQNQKRIQELNRSINQTLERIRGLNSEIKKLDK